MVFVMEGFSGPGVIAIDCRWARLAGDKQAKQAKRQKQARHQAPSPLLLLVFLIAIMIRACFAEAGLGRAFELFWNLASSRPWAEQLRLLSCAFFGRARCHTADAVRWNTKRDWELAAAVSPPTPLFWCQFETRGHSTGRWQMCAWANRESPTYRVRAHTTKDQSVRGGTDDSG
jgi:hypothetical protein